jgi:ketosteroid isomerase-like protein
MNEQENTRLVQQAYHYVQTGDIQALLNSFAEDVHWQLPEMENVPFAGTWEGREGVRQFFNKVLEVQDVVEFEPQEYIAQREKVVVLGRFLMRIKASGRDFASDWAHVWTIQDDKVTGFYEYVDTAIVSGAHAAKAVTNPRQRKMGASSASGRAREERQIKRGKHP